MNDLNKRLKELETKLAKLEREKELLEARLDELRRIVNLQAMTTPIRIERVPVTPTPAPWPPPTITWKQNTSPPNTFMCLADVNDQPLIDAGLGG